MAKRFRFRLQNVLRYRQRLEEKAKKDLALAQRDLIEQQRRLDRLWSERAEQQARLASKAVARLDMSEVMSYHSYIYAIEARLRREGLELVRREAAAEKKRLELVEASRAKRALEILREKRFGEYLKYLDSEERKALDEIKPGSIGGEALIGSIGRGND